jgi:hypothetical protein
MFIVALGHVRFSFSQPLRDVRDRISERPESTRTFFLAVHGATRRMRNTLLNREVLVVRILSPVPGVVNRTTRCYSVMVLRFAHYGTNITASNNSRVADSTSSAPRIAVITAAPNAPARRISRARAAVTPPIPIIGIRTRLHAFSRM